MALSVSYVPLRELSGHDVTMAACQKIFCYLRDHGSSPSIGEAVLKSLGPESSPWFSECEC